MWLYGLVFVSIINLSSFVGALVIPCANKTYYKRLLMFMVSIAVGTLVGSGLLHLIPEVTALIRLVSRLERANNGLLLVL